MLPHLDERSRRLVLGSVALAAGDGGVTAVARASGAAWQTVADGAAELESGTVVQGRARRAGGGRKRAEDEDPGLVPALLALVEDGVRGDPQSPLAWTTKLLRNLAGELRRRGTGVAGYGRAAAARAGVQLAGQRQDDRGQAAPGPGRPVPVHRRAGREHIAAGQPVISVDAKKKEQVGPFGAAGREWRPAGRAGAGPGPRLP